MNEQSRKEISISVIGAGTMGTALAQLLAESGHKIRLWAYEPELAVTINQHHRNEIFLPDISLSNQIHATNSLEDAIGDSHYVFSVTPSQVLRGIWMEARQFLSEDAVIVSASKGVETSSTLLMSEVFEEVLAASSSRLAFLSGPSFAREILAGQPTAVVIASANLSLATSVQHLISTPTFRAYTTDDVVGVELGGALKNVIAIAVGVAEGMGLGFNSRSALITRGLAEITRLSVACGANPLTLAGLAGMGDLIPTCTGHLSRNLQVGIRLGKGESIEQVVNSMKMVAEGVATAHSTLALAKRHAIEMPITEIVVQLLTGAVQPDEAVQTLMGRQLRSEKEH